MGFKLTLARAIGTAAGWVYARRCGFVFLACIAFVGASLAGVLGDLVMWGVSSTLLAGAITWLLWAVLDLFR